MAIVHHRYATVDGHRLFYREAGDDAAPVLVLLHGFPTSSHMFRHLIPALAGEYRVIAPDLLGFGLSDAPSVDTFDYTFDALTALTAGLLRSLGVERYAMYVQDYGAPIGWRLALGKPAVVTAIISQNGNAYDAGFVESFWKTVWDYRSAQTPESEAQCDAVLHAGSDAVAIRDGVQGSDLRRSRVVVPTIHWGCHGPEMTLCNSPCSGLCNEPTAVSAAARVLPSCSRVPLLAVWGRGDQIFGPAVRKRLRRISRCRYPSARRRTLPA
jgi:pimeloyl-ACP methyl ester carboxylesterase